MSSTNVNAKHSASPRSPARRPLRDGSAVAEEAMPVSVSIQTRCPSKWAFVDLETGEIWAHDQKRGFVRALPAQIQQVLEVSRALSK